MLWLYIVATLAVVASVNATPPNFVMLFVDDLGYGDLGFNGNPTIPTPNLDRMTQEGIILNQWYSAYPSCSPSRAALLTGRLPRRTGMNGVLSCNAAGGILANETLLPELLKTQNYATAHIGKWHIGQRPQFLPTKHGFDYYFGIPFSADMGGLPPNYPDESCVWLPLVENDKVIEQPVDLWGLGPRYVEKAVDFITKNKNNPFFLYMAFNHVHVTIPPVKQWASPNFTNSTLRGPFGDAVAEMDWMVGEILDALQSLGLAENTLVVFTSDNGPWLVQQLYAGSSGLFFEGKFTTWEGGIRMPAVAWWPGSIKPNTRTNAVVSTMDVYTTFATLAGAKLPTDRIIDGKDITNVLLKNGESPHENLFFWNHAKQDYEVFAIRHGAFKVHYWTVNSSQGEAPVQHTPPLLFNVEHDPSEKYALDIKLYQNILAAFDQAKAEHLAHMIPGPDQGALGHNMTYSVCCDWARSCRCN